MLKNAPVIILDEATAYTDPENEAPVQSSVARPVQGKTLLVIAHRLSTIAPAQQKANRDLVAAVIEFVQGIADVKNYNLVSSRAKKPEAAIKAKQNGDTHLEYAVIPYITLQEIVTKLTGVLMCAASVYFYIGGSMSLLYCIMMTISSFMIYESLDVMAGFSALIRSVSICVDQANEILSIPEMDIESADITSASRDIELKHITFAYENRMIIDGVDLKIPEHTTTALVGPSGSEKSTIAKLIASFWDVDSGSISFGGVDIRKSRSWTTIGISPVFRWITTCLMKRSWIISVWATRMRPMMM